MLQKKRKILREGFLHALPISVAIGSYGLSFGILAKHVGFSAVQTSVMSVMVFSGSIQMMTLALKLRGSGWVSIIITAMLINLRNLLYGAALSKGLEPAGRWRWFLAFGVSDEPFVLGSSRFASVGPDPWYFGMVWITFYVAWVLSTTLGVFVSHSVHNPLTTYGVALAYPMTFAAMIGPMVHGKSTIITISLAVAITGIFTVVWPSSSVAIVVAGFFSPLVGALTERNHL